MHYGCQSMYKNIEQVLLKHPKDAFISQKHLTDNWKKFNYVDVPEYETTLQEYLVFEGIIKRYIPHVYYLPQSNQVGIDSIYTHDALKITENGAVYFNTGKPLRKNEAARSESFLLELGVKTLGRIAPPGKMEGGDVVWLHEKCVAIGLGYRTNEEGIRQFKQLTSDFIDEYIVVPLPHAAGEDACLHLMSLISIIDKDLAVVYSKYMPVFFRDYLSANHFELVEVNAAEYDRLGANVLALAPRVCLLLAGNLRIEKMLLANGCVVHTYPGRELSIKGTGGPTCLTCPIARV